MRKPVIAGNWKMHLTLQEAESLVTQLKASCEIAAWSDWQVEVVVCPPFTALATVGRARGDCPMALGAQDVFWEPEGAFTGEISPKMLLDIGCRFVIIGHSERRQHFGETNETVRRKLQAALAAGLTPIVCVGETLAERDAHRTFEVLTQQLEGAFNNVSANDMARIIIAYEPVWAIGTGQNATPAQAQEAQAFIREWVRRQWNADVAKAIRIQYGGSVTASNALELLQQPDVDGALVGGASLKAESFASIVKAATEAKTAPR